MIYKIEEANESINRIYSVDLEKYETYKNYVELFTDKYVTLEEMTLVMLDDPLDQKMVIDSLCTAYRQVRVSLFLDLKKKVNQNGK